MSCSHFLWGFVLGPCFVMQYLVSFLYLQLSILVKEESACCFSFIDLLQLVTVGVMLSLSHSVENWLAMCDCGISWLYLLFWPFQLHYN